MAASEEGFATANSQLENGDVTVMLRQVEQEPASSSTSRMPPQHDKVELLKAESLKTLDQKHKKSKALPKLSRREMIAKKRKEFASGLFNEDLSNLAKWHRFRTPHEQQRFLQSLDTMYSSWVQKGERFYNPEAKTEATLEEHGTIKQLMLGGDCPTIPEDQIIPPELLPAGSDLQAQTKERLAEQEITKMLEAETKLKASDLGKIDPKILEERLGSGMSAGTGSKKSRSLPSIHSNASSNRSGAQGMARHLQPIDVFEANTRKKRAKPAVASLTMDQWLEANSQASTQSRSTAVTEQSWWTGVSEMTCTTQGSLDSAPCPVMKTQFRNHRRAFAINRRKWKTRHNTDGVAIPTQQYPPERQFRTTTKLAYPSHCEMELNPLDVTKDDKMYASVFRPDTHGFIKDMLLGGNEGTAPNAKAVATANGATSGLNVPADKKKEQFEYLVRCLQNVRLESKPKTQTARDFDSVENHRLYKPTRAQPGGSIEALLKSRVPLHTLNESLAWYKEQIGLDPGKKPHDLLELIDDNISECSWMNSAPSEGAPSELFPILNQVCKKS